MLKPSIVLVVLCVLVRDVTADGQCGSNVRGVRIVANPEDCSSYFICHGQQQFRFTCPSSAGHESLFDPVSRTCVPKGSIYDHSACHTNMQFTEPKCVPGVVRTEADPDNCARYYRCDGGYEVQRGECPYPRLYNRRSHTCELFTFVNCDVRKEPKDPCDYTANQCTEAQCVPCRTRFGTCVKRTDGPHVWEGKSWTPFYVLCKNERVLLQGDCRENGQLKIFHPVWRRCMTPYEVISSMGLGTNANKPV